MQIRIVDKTCEKSQRERLPRATLITQEARTVPRASLHRLIAGKFLKELKKLSHRQNHNLDHP